MRNFLGSCAAVVAVAVVSIRIVGRQRVHGVQWMNDRGLFLFESMHYSSIQSRNRICQRYFWLVKQQLEHRSHWFTPQWECALTEKYAHVGAQSKSKIMRRSFRLSTVATHPRSMLTSKMSNISATYTTASFGRNKWIYDLSSKINENENMVVCFERTAPPKMRGWGRCGFWGLLDC